MTHRIDFNKIGYQKVVEMLRLHHIKEAQDIEQFKATRNIGSHPNSDFLYHVTSFNVDAPAALVWQAYKTIKPPDAWAGKLIDFALLYSPQERREYYPTDEAFPEAKVGQILFIGLNFVRGLVKIAVGHKIIRVDEDARELESSYLECSASQGSQVIRVRANGPDKSIIEHETWYKSGNWFRDKVLYPPLHNLTISQLHNNVKAHILRQT